MKIPDLSASAWLRSETRQLPGLLEQGVPLEQAIDSARVALAGKGPVPGGGFRLEIDSAGSARVSLSDVPSLRRLESVLSGSPELSGSRVGSDFVQVVEERAGVPWRMVLECFYGNLWSHEERLETMLYAVRLGANGYVYGPSADRRTGGLWREFYEGIQEQELSLFVGRARVEGVRTVWRVSPSAPIEPGRAFRFSDSQEISCLLSKVDHVLKIGFDSVLIAFDDLSVPPKADELQKYEGSDSPAASAHAAVINAVADHVGSARVLACPTHYWGTDESVYRRVFSQELNSDIEICWTGPEVISSTITERDILTVEKQYRRAVWIWDNYPVNDWDMAIFASGPHSESTPLDNLVGPRHLPLAPVRGRDRGLLRTSGYGANGAIGARSGLPALLTCVDLAWCPQAYEASSSWRSTLEMLDLPLSAVDSMSEASAPIIGPGPKDIGSLARACLDLASCNEDMRDQCLENLEAAIARDEEAIHLLRAHPTEFLRDVQPWVDSWARQVSIARNSVLAIKGEDRAEAIQAITEILKTASPSAMCTGAADVLGQFTLGSVHAGAPELPF